MSEPLTKDKISTECDESCACDDSCTPDTQIVHLRDLKSALKYFENLVLGDDHIKVNDGLHIIWLLQKKAFPAIYEVEK